MGVFKRQEEKAEAAYKVAKAQNDAAKSFGKAARRTLAAFGNNKPCPSCGRYVKMRESSCGNCGHTF